MNPSNILLGYNGDVKICDFGIAKSRFSLTKTKAGVIKGKARYLSPEQAAGEELDFKTDIFSAGLVLFELLTGKQVWSGNTDVEILKQAKNGVLPPFKSEWKSIPPRLAVICKKAMAVKPENRYAHAADFAKALGIYLRKEAMGYGRDSFSTFMKELFSKEILLDNARLEQIELSEPKNVDQGEDLIADDAWEHNQFGFNDFLNYDAAFPQQSDPRPSGGVFPNRGTQVHDKDGGDRDTQNEVSLKEVSGHTDKAQIKTIGKKERNAPQGTTSRNLKISQGSKKMRP